MAVVISFIHGTPHAMEEEKVTLGVGGLKGGGIGRVGIFISPAVLA